jgi:hypothetical protein
MKGKKETFKIQSNVEEYTYYVLDGLIRIKGTSISDVVSYVIKSWIDQNKDLLESMGLSVDSWRNK